MIAGMLDYKIMLDEWVLPTVVQFNDFLSHQKLSCMEKSVSPSMLKAQILQLTN